MQIRNREVIGEWGSWWSTLAPWNWFATFTFSEMVTSATARYWFRRYLQMIEDVINGTTIESPSRSNGYGYVDADLSQLRVEVKAFRGDEFSPQNGRLHIHALIAGVESLLHHCGKNLPATEWGRKCCWTHAWPCGYARILPYDPNLGASHYVAKFTTSPLSDWELYGFSGNAASNISSHQSPKCGRRYGES